MKAVLCVWIYLYTFCYLSFFFLYRKINYLNFEKIKIINTHGFISLVCEPRFLPLFFYIYLFYNTTL